MDGAVHQVRLPRPPRVGDLGVKDNRATVLRFIEDLFNTGDRDIADEVLASDYVDHSPSHPGLSGPENFKRSVSEWLTAFPDTVSVVRDIIEAVRHTLLKPET
ncbi:MAG: ester cyclase [Rubrobacteraceae bacterium]